MDYCNNFICIIDIKNNKGDLKMKTDWNKKKKNLEEEDFDEFEEEEEIEVVQ